MNKTLVTGAAGFIGFHLCKRLLEDGYKVIAIDNLNSYYDVNLKKARLTELEKTNKNLFFHKVDIENKKEIEKIFNNYLPEKVFNLAAQAGVRHSIENPEVYIDSNVVGFLNVLECARPLDACRIINLNSSGAYGDAAFGDNILFEANTDPDPKTIYAVTKFASERIGTRMGELWNLDVVSVRLSAVFGRWERQTNVRDTPSPLYQIASLILNGENVKLSREDCRDWIYAPDIARAVRAVRDANQLRHPVYNISLIFLIIKSFVYYT